MKIAPIALAVLVPALAAADPAPYVVREGRAVAPGISPIRPISALGMGTIHAGVASGAAASRRGFRSSGRRGIMGAAPSGGTGAATTPSAPPPYATPGAKILSAGRQPLYSDPGNGGTHSVEGGGFIAIDQSRAHDVGRTPGISWGPRDTPPSANSHSGAGGTGASSNGPAGGGAASAAPATAPSSDAGAPAQGATGFDPTF